MELQNIYNKGLKENKTYTEYLDYMMDTEQELVDLILPKGSYTHSAVSAKLRLIADETNKETANYFVDKLNLTKLLGIPKATIKE